MTQQRVLRKALTSLAATLVLSGCGGGGGGGSSQTTTTVSNDQQTRTITWSGAGVKGPMSGAAVRFYAVNSNGPMLYDPNRPVGSAFTGDDGTFTEVTLDTGVVGPFVVVVDGTDAIDIHTGRAPVISELITVVSEEDFAARRPIYATPLTTLTVATARMEIPNGISATGVMSAVDRAALEVTRNFGFGLLDGVDIMRDAPMLNESINTPDAQHTLTKHRAAIEAASAAVYSMMRASGANHADDVIADLALDVASDGMIDGTASGATLRNVDATLFYRDPTSFVVPDTDISIADIGTIIESEATLQNVNVELFADSLIVTDPIVESTETVTSTTSSTSTSNSSTTSTSSSTSTTRSSSTTSSSSSTAGTTTTTLVLASTTTSTAPATTTTTASTTSTTRSTTTTTTAPPTTTTTTVFSGRVTTTYYVDNNNSLANDANIGSSSLPFKTINRAAQAARAGDKVIVKPGLYRESVFIANSGTVSQPITFSASGSVLVDSPSTDNYTGVFDIVGKTDIVISGFSIKNAYYGVRADVDRAGTPSERITVKNNYITMSRSSGIRTNGARNITVEGNIVEKTNWGGVHEMISLGETDGFVIRNNEVFNGTWTMNGLPVEGKEGIDVKSGSSNGVISGNKVHDLVRLGIYADAWSRLSENIVITDNIVYNCKQGIALSSESGGLLKNVLVANNVTYNNTNFGIIASSWALNGPRENIRIINNTVYGNASGGIGISTSNIYLVYIQNNIVAGNGGGAISATNVGTITNSSNNLVSGRSSGNVTFGVTSGDPRFINAGSADFRLSSGSPAINAGRTSTEVSKDIRGTARPLGGAYDIGAYESY